jgi:phospholipid/cholesterol/gamma-HCH transport system substrate-binding protein
MGRNHIETVMGAVVVAVAVFFFVFAYNTANIQTVKGYHVTAKFDRIDGINEGSDVRMSGIKIGTVRSQSLDPKTYLAVVTLSIDPSVELPTDTSASITSDGLLGDKYLALSPGGSDKMIPDGGQIETTQGSIDLFSLVGQLIFSQTGKEGEDKGANDLR